MATSPETARLQQLEHDLNDYIDADDGDRDHDSDDSKKFAQILTDVCNVIRKASASDPQYASILKKSDEILNKGLKHAHLNADERLRPESFAHCDDSPEVFAAQEGRLETLLGHGLIQEFLQLIYRNLPPSADPVVNERMAQSPPWPKSPRPHQSSSRLARFTTKPTAITPTTLHPTATFISQARCEISADSICVPHRARISPGGTCLAVTSAGGHKNRDAILDFHLLDDVNSERFRVHSFETRLENPAPFITLHEPRKLIFVADDQRIKSFAWAAPNGEVYDSGLAVHTMDSKSYQGPLAFLTGNTLVRAGKGFVGCWDLRSLSTHGPEGVKRLGKRYRPCADHFDYDERDIEPSWGSEASSTIKLSDPTLSPTVWETHPSSPGSMICGFDWQQTHTFSCFVVDLEHGGSIVTRFLGHGSDTTEISTTAADPNVFVTGCEDGYARLFDMRQPLPTMTFNAGRCSSDCSAVALAYPDGIPTLFTGSQKQQEVRLWDIRAHATVYELSTGNTNVASLAWDDAHTTLYAATECDYIDHIGNHDYRRAKEPKFLREERNREDADGEDEYDCDDDDDDEDRCWPQRAFHGEEYFGYMYDAGEHMLIRYKFKEEPDITVLPEYGRAYVNDGMGYW